MIMENILFGWWLYRDNCNLYVMNIIRIINHLLRLPEGTKFGEMESYLLDAARGRSLACSMPKRRRKRFSFVRQ